VYLRNTEKTRRAPRPGSGCLKSKNPHEFSTYGSLARQKP
jgi:hypothetical protein